VYKKIMANPSVINNPNIKCYLTSLEPDISQTIFSQSIGGYRSDSVIYPQTTLNNTIGLYETSLSFDLPENGNWSEWNDVSYISINDEIIKIGNMSKDVEGVNRGINGIVSMHLSKDIVTGLSTNIFNSTFNDDYKQFRCFAIRNEPEFSFEINNLEIYLSQNTINSNCVIDISVSVPSNQYLMSSSTSWSKSAIVDKNAIPDDPSGAGYAGNSFLNSYLKVLSGPNTGVNRLISSDGKNGIFTFYDDLPVDYDSSLYSSEIDYEIEPGPTSRSSSGYMAPLIESQQSWIGYGETIEVDISESRFGNIFYPKDVFYVWVRRTLEKGKQEVNNDSFVLGLKYKS
jgi:hypothetical protein